MLLETPVWVNMFFENWCSPIEAIIGADWSPSSTSKHGDRNIRNIASITLLLSSYPPQLSLGWCKGFSKSFGPNAAQPQVQRFFMPPRQRSLWPMKMMPSMMAFTTYKRWVIVSTPFWSQGHAPWSGSFTHCFLGWFVSCWVGGSAGETMGRCWAGVASFISSGSPRHAFRIRLASARSCQSKDAKKKRDKDWTWRWKDIANMWKINAVPSRSGAKTLRLGPTCLSGTVEVCRLCSSP